MASENDPTTPDTTADAVLAGRRPREAQAAPRDQEGRAHPAAEPDGRCRGRDRRRARRRRRRGPDGEGAPAKKATRKRAAKKTTTKAAAKSPAKRAKKAAATQEPAAAEEPTPDAPVDQDAELPLDEVDDDELTEAETDRADEAPAAAPSFGLLFQAPEPVATRRRRATSPAQAPAERVAEEEPATLRVRPRSRPPPRPRKPRPPPRVAAPSPPWWTRLARCPRRTCRGGPTPPRAEQDRRGPGRTPTRPVHEGGRGPDERSTDEGEGSSRSRRPVVAAAAAAGAARATTTRPARHPSVRRGRRDRRHRSR